VLRHGALDRRARSPAPVAAAAGRAVRITVRRAAMPPIKQPMKFGVGQSVLRKEDDPLLRGRGRYVADHAPAGLLHAVVLRSPHAHARFRISDMAKARALPGVVLILTGADVAGPGPPPRPRGGGGGPAPGAALSPAPAAG